ncbi:XrtV sorting system accessory protein [Sphingomonas bacterium]|uniref:XrtV sorting system accessory protein n=1 Tax=Sphingomonas bacterium TaxID=1895847 RepID=UPI001575AB65|nr:XrtV sorting system accessory protein [Sphingomonas bacterium]
MTTIFDWVTVAIFAGLIVLFLQRSTAEVQVDKVTDYLPPALCCAAGNVVGNNGHPILAGLLIASIPLYVWFVLKPFRR